VRPLTASAGVATFPAHAGDSEQLIEAADTALLQAKSSGRDRTVMSSGLPGHRRSAGSADPPSDRV
jgi:predicted signal transduction protein with EAL and GGDEF domain